MISLRSFLRSLTPHGFVEKRRQRIRLRSLGLNPTVANERAINECHFELWPRALRMAIEPWTLIDVGANEGEFTAAAATVARIDTVYAFEPQPRCISHLKQNLAEVTNAHVIQAAVGGAKGEVEIFCAANSKMSGALRAVKGICENYSTGDFLPVERLRVPMVRLDDVIRPRSPIGLLKIDVQGYELEVLKGADLTLRSTSVVLLEINYVPHYEYAATFDQVYRRLHASGFALKGVSRPYCGIQGPLWADAIFVQGGTAGE